MAILIVLGFLYSTEESPQIHYNLIPSISPKKIAGTPVQPVTALRTAVGTYGYRAERGATVSLFDYLVR